MPGKEKGGVVCVAGRAVVAGWGERGGGHPRHK